MDKIDVIYRPHLPSHVMIWRYDRIYLFVCHIIASPRYVIIVEISYDWSETHRVAWWMYLSSVWKVQFIVTSTACGK